MNTITYNDKTYKIPKPFNECYFGKEPTKEMTLLIDLVDRQQLCQRLQLLSMTLSLVLNVSKIIP